MIRGLDISWSRKSPNFCTFIGVNAHVSNNHHDNLQVFAIFCGLFIHNVLNYEQKCKALAHYSVALEVN